MRVISFYLICFLFSYSAACAQQDILNSPVPGDTVSKSTQIFYAPLNDSLATTDHVQFMADSIAMFYLIPDPLREDQFISKLYRYGITGSDAYSYGLANRRVALQTGSIRESGKWWIIAAIICLIIYTALVNIFFSKDVSAIIQPFYNDHPISTDDRESRLINPQAFIGLFVLFCFSLGLVLYQLTIYNGVFYQVNGFRLFLFLSVLTGVLFAFKFLLLKFIGLIFDLNQLVGEYISILNLTYFNIAFVLLGLAMCLSLLSSRFVPVLLIITLVLAGIIFIWQYLRNSVNMVNNLKFHKFYLFIYLCALEFCPILILIKALDI